MFISVHLRLKILKSPVLGEPPTPLELRSADFSPQATETSEPQMDVDAAAVFQSRQWVPLKATGLGGQSAEGSVEMARR